MDRFVQGTDRIGSRAYIVWVGSERAGYHSTVDERIIYDYHSPRAHEPQRFLIVSGISWLIGIDHNKIE